MKYYYVKLTRGEIDIIQDALELMDKKVTRDINTELQRAKIRDDDKSMIICKNCDTPNDEERSFCRSCGEMLK